MTFDPASSAPPPSAEVLGDLARRVADAYPDLYAHLRSGVAFSYRGNCVHAREAINQ